jgi:sialidase-1
MDTKYLATLLYLLLGGISGSGAEKYSVTSKKTVVVKPAISAKAIANPGKGWVAYGKAENQSKEAVDLNQQNLVFRAGENGYSCFRAPSMVVTPGGTILVFSEGRVNSSADEGDIDIVLRRSTNNGKNWTAIQVIENDGPNPCKNQCPVVLPNGHILLVWLWNKSISSERERTTREVYYTYSDDEGKTWVKSRNITSSVSRPDWGWSGMGPCHGIVKTFEPHKGRIIIPSRHEEKRSFSHVIYSDDNGETWQIGGSALRNQTTESTVVELSDGSIMLNSRNGRDGEQFRMISLSHDGGQTFYSTTACQQLNEPTCQGVLLRHSIQPETGQAILLFSNPDSSEKSVRVNGTIRVSSNDGINWIKSYRYSQPAPAFSGYSDLALMPDGQDVAVVYESGKHYKKGLRYDGIAFHIVKKECIMK